MSQAIRTRLRKHEYDHITSAHALADSLGRKPDRMYAFAGSPMDSGRRQSRLRMKARRIGDAPNRDVRASTRARLIASRWRRRLAGEATLTHSSNTDSTTG